MVGKKLVCAPDGGQQAEAGDDREHPGDQHRKRAKPLDQVVW